MARKTSMRARHWGILFSYLLVVMLPLAAIGWYLMERTTDQYASTAGFSVRKEEAASPSEIIGGLSQFVAGPSGASDTDIIYEFIQSQDLVARIDQKLNLTSHFSAPHAADPVFALAPNGTIEDLLDHWQRMVRISYTQSTGLINVEVLAFSPDMAQRIASAIIAESQNLVNKINVNARNDVLKYAEADLGEALTRLKLAREAMVHFRTRTQIVDPLSDLEGRMGVLNGLQQQLAEALIEYDLLAQNTAATDTRVVQAQRRIDVIRARMSEERALVSEGDGVGEAYPDLLAEYESLIVDREFAEETYRAALAALDIARAGAVRQSRYLATYVHPTRAEAAEYPRHWMIFGLAALFLLLTWGILTLAFYSLRDRK